MSPRLDSKFTKAPAPAQEKSPVSANNARPRYDDERTRPLDFTDIPRIWD